MDQCHPTKCNEPILECEVFLGLNLYSKRAGELTNKL